MAADTRIELTITAPVTLVVAPYKEVPNVPPGYTEARRYGTKEGALVVECWPAGVSPPHLATVPVR